MMQLFGVPGSGSAIVEIMLTLAEERYDFIDVTGSDVAGAARSRLAAVNPLVQVPTLILDDGTTLTESAAIALWFGERHPFLFPSPGSREHARSLRLLIWIAATVYPTFTYGDHPDRWVPSAPEELVSATDRHRERLYLWLEEQTVGPWILGKDMSALDCYVAVLVGWRPGQPWFRDRNPRLLAVAEALWRDPRLTAVVVSNKLGQ